MILILGKRSDVSTSDVAEWLLHYKKEYIIVNTDSEQACHIRKVIPQRQMLIIENNGKKIDLSTITSVWNRRYGFNPQRYISDFLPESTPKSRFWDKDYQYADIKNEGRLLFAYIHYIIDSKSVKVLGSYANNNVNKLIILDIAKMKGLEIPQSFILTQKTDLEQLKKHADKETEYIITKPIGQGIHKDINKKNAIYHYHTYVERVTDDLISSTPESFFPSLFQIEIKKKYELRIFYLLGKFYSMAIFSQEQEGAQVDFRKYSGQKPLKCVPYLLPNDIESKLKLLMDSIGLNTGSIDMIVDENEKHIFLEVNPIGQFAMTSIPCNYYLEKKIAAFL